MWVARSVTAVNLEKKLNELEAEGYRVENIVPVSGRNVDFVIVAQKNVEPDTRPRPDAPRFDSVRY